jgi:carboxymethylenebutenolidase
MKRRSEAIQVEGGAVPTALLEPDDASRAPALVVVPSIYGPAPDLIARLAEFAEAAVVVLPDPFWRVGGGAVAYDEGEKARSRLAGFDLGRCIADLEAVLAWAAARSNGRVIGLGICFGGPFVLRFAGEGRLAGVVTWHGSRMENFLARARETRCPLRLHFGSADPLTPPEVIETIRAAFAANPDVSIVVHPGARHGFSHDGPAFDAGACRAGLDAVRDLLRSPTALAHA